MQRSLIVRTLFVGAALLAAIPANAAIVWTNWTGQSFGGSGQTINQTAIVNGTVGGTSVTYNGDVYFAQTDGTGTNFWTPWPVPGEQPPGTDIIAINSGGTKTITFGTAVTDIYIALNSWNTGGTTSFSAPFSVVGTGTGYWGTGTLTPNVGNSSFFSGSGNELHGILKFSGSFTSLTFTDTSEAWHGIQVGIGSVGGAVPEPATWTMMIGGFGMIGGALRSRRRKTLAIA